MAQPSASGNVTLGSVRSIGGFLPKTLVHATASTLRNIKGTAMHASVRVALPSEPSFFLLIRYLLAPFSERHHPTAWRPALCRPRSIAVASSAGCLVATSQ